MDLFNVWLRFRQSAETATTTEELQQVLANFNRYIMALTKLSPLRLADAAAALDWNVPSAARAFAYVNMCADKVQTNLFLKEAVNV
jgi:hypothetical protein